MFPDPDKQVMERAYARWAPVYDTLCGPVFVNGRRAAAQAARAVGGRILEIGVGTGLSFGDFLRLNLPGTKVVVGDGPARAMLKMRFPDAVFLGARRGEALAEIYAAAGVFVFPSRTDTFGLVLLEALASGLPVAGVPVAAPRDLIGATAVGFLDEDLRSACLGALACERAACREFAIGMSWERSARAFVEHVTTAAAARQLAA